MDAESDTQMSCNFGSFEQKCYPEGRGSSPIAAAIDALVVKALAEEAVHRASPRFREGYGPMFDTIRAGARSIMAMNNRTTISKDVDDCLKVLLFGICVRLAANEDPEERYKTLKIETEESLKRILTWATFDTDSAVNIVALGFNASLRGRIIDTTVISPGKTEDFRQIMSNAGLLSII